MSMKKFVKVFLTALFCLSCVLGVTTACGGNGTDAAKIEVDGQDFTVEVNETFRVPAARLVDKEGAEVVGTVDVSVVNPNNVVVATSVLDLKARMIGEYRITYSHQGLEDVTVRVLSQDSKGPVLSLDNTFANLYRGEAVLLPNVDMEDFSEIDLESAIFRVYYVEEGAREEKTINQLANSFIADKAGEYVYRVEVSDVIGNKTVREWSMTVTDKTWTDANATGADVATFDSAEYKNVFGAGTATDRQGNPRFEILDAYEGATGVARVDMNYFDHNFGNYSSFNLRFPREYRYEEGKRLALKLRTEELTCDNGRINLIAFEHTHVTGVGVSILKTYSLKAGEWTTLILDNDLLRALKDENDLIRGIQLDVKQSADRPDSAAQTIYLASVTEIETLEAPRNLRIEGAQLVWDEVAGASGYLLSVNEVETRVQTNAADLPQGAYTAKVRALGDGTYFESSAFGESFGNVLRTPTGLTIDGEGVLSWEAVDNASGYIVSVNGEEFPVAATTYSFTGAKDKNYLIKVRAKGDNGWYDSENTGLALRYLPQPEGYVADFADESFVYDVLQVNASNLVGMAAEAFRAQYLETYEGANGVLRIDMTTDGSALGWAIVSLKLPDTLRIDETLQAIRIRFRLEGVPGGDYAGLRVYGMGSDGAGRDLSPVTTFGFNGINAWYTGVIDRTAILSGFNNASASDYMLFGIANVPPYTDFRLYLDEITEERKVKLAAPQNLALNGTTLTWDEVEHATGYLVSINDRETPTETNSFELPVASEAYTVTVKATGGERYLASDDSEPLTNVLPVPQRLRYEGGQIVWDAADGAENYVLEINGDEIDVEGATAYAFTPEADTNYVIRVKTATHGAMFESAFDKGFAIRGKAQPNGYLADFSDGTFVYDVTDANAYNLAPMAAEAFEAEYLPSYEGASGVLKIDLTVSKTAGGGWAVVSLKLPETLQIDETLQSLGIKFRLEGIPATENGGLRVYGYGSDAAGRDLSPATSYGANGVGEWYSAVIDRTAILAGFNNSSTSRYILFGVANAPMNSTFRLYLDEITCVRSELPPRSETTVADFSDASCESSVANVNVSNLAEMAAASYSAQYVESYAGKSGVLKISAVTGANTWAVVSLKLPSALVIDETLTALKMTFRLEGIPGGAYAGLRVYGYGDDAQGRDLSPAETYASDGIGSWYTATVSREKILSGFNNAASSEYILFGVAGVGAGTSFDLYLDEIIAVTAD